MGGLGRRRRERPEEVRTPAFVQCPGCSFNFVTGEGTRSCNWSECPYLPEEYKVFCPECYYNFATGEGNPHCSDPPTCDWTLEGYKRAELARKRFGAIG